MRVRQLTLGPFQANCYITALSSGGDAVVIDPGAEVARIDEVLEEDGAALRAILLTHAHLDHIGAVGELKARHGADLYLHPADRPLYDQAPRQATAFGLEMEPLPAPDFELEHGQLLELAGLSFSVRHAPGHSPGGVIFLSEDCAFVGDCIFLDSIGRTDLPGGDTETLFRSIREQILTLPPETVLYTGHGAETTVRREASANPFLTGAYGWSG